MSLKNTLGPDRGGKEIELTQIFNLERIRFTSLVWTFIAPEATYLFGGPERLPPGGDILADLAEDGPGAASGGHVSLARSRASVEVLLSRQSEYDGIESFI